MDRRNFLGLFAAGGGALASGTIPVLSGPVSSVAHRKGLPSGQNELNADVVIAGGGLGGFAATMAALRNGQSVILTEETDWIGGQMTQQGLSCPDEHQWIETHGATQLYRDYRLAVREYYKRNYPLTEAARSRRDLNPGDGSVSRLCHEPRVALAILNNMIAPYLSSGKLRLLLEYKIVSAEVSGNKVRALKARRTNQDKNEIWLTAPYFIDATELGELLPLTGTEYVTGSESRNETRELHAAEKANPANNQAINYCFAMDYVPGVNNIIDKPAEYDFWRNYIPKLDSPWPGNLLSMAYSDPKTLKPKTLGFNPEGVATGNALNLWNYRKIINKNNFDPNFYKGDITIVNWPQNDYFLGDLIGASEKEFKKYTGQAKQLSLSLFYWLQTEVNRPDGKQGWPGLRLRGDIMGTEDGLAKYPYIRESRRIKAVFTVLEEHVGIENRALITGKKSDNIAANFYDSVGIGYYHIDLHPTTGGNNYIDFGSMPFQIPLGALLPQRVENLIPANKNIGTTHITNGCYRLHPVEWSIGEAAGLLVSYALRKKILPRAVRDNVNTLEDFQNFIRANGIETHWPKE
jgi:hypothetical protein